MMIAFWVPLAVFLICAAILIAVNLGADALRARWKHEPKARTAWYGFALSHFGAIILAIPAFVACLAAALASGQWLGIQDRPGPPAPGFGGPPWWYYLGCLIFAALVGFAVSICVFFLLVQRFRNKAA